MQVIIDRFEKDFAKVEIEEGILVDIPKILVPNTKEGDVIDIIVNEEATKLRNNEVQDLINDLFI